MTAVETALFWAVTLGFAAAALLALQQLFAMPPQPAPAQGLPTAAAQRRAAACTALWCGAVIALMLLWCALRLPGAPLLQAWESWCGGGIDAPHYLNLARYGYGTGEEFAEQYLMIVFFPLWPWLLRPFVLLGCNAWVTGTALNVGFTVAGAVLLYRFAARLWGARRAGWAVAFQLLLPGSFFFVIPQTEALFFFLSMAFLEAVQSKRCALAGAFGFLAALCRANGVLLAGYAMACAIAQWRAQHKARPQWLWPCVLPFAGFGAYLGLNYAVYGNAWQFTIYQKEHWTHTMGWVGDTVRTLCGMCGYMEGTQKIFLAAWGLGTVLAELALLVLAARYLPAPWLLLGLAGYALANGQTWLISAPRYALGITPLAPALVCLTPRRTHRLGAAAVLAALWAVYFFAFLQRWWIY